MIEINVENILYEHKETIRTSLLIRKVEEKLLQLYAEGKLHGTIHTCVGQELIGPCLVTELWKDDFIVTGHRGHGHYIARTGDFKGLIAEIMGKETGVCRGVGGSQHIFNHKFMANGIQGGMTPIATGVALGYQLRNEKNISIAFIGDGSLGQGVVYESLNLCGLWNLPILFILENNGYAQSTSMKQTFSGVVQKRVEGFGLKYIQAHTWDIALLKLAIAEAVDMVRNQKTPCLLEIQTYRLNPHTKGNDNRSKDELQKFKQKDILNQLILSKNPEIEKMITEIDDKIEKAVIESLNDPILHNYTSYESKSFQVEYQEISQVTVKKRINELIYEFFKEIFNEDDRCIMIGEDIEYKNKWAPNHYGGAFKITKDLSELFQGRIKNTPISEAAIVGVGTGLALAGMRPFVEIMFGDFITLIFDQIVNHATKFCEMYGKKLDIPLVVRTPMGGHRGYGPTHSQSLEKFFLGIPNLFIVALNHRINPKDVYSAVYYNNSQPTLVIENKVLYTRNMMANQIKGFKIQKTDENFQTLRITPDGFSPDVSVVCYGGILEDVEKAIELAFDEEEILCEVICPTLINPINIQPILDSVINSEKLLIVEEGPSIAALGSEIAAMIAEKGLNLKKLKRLGCNTIIPCSVNAENNVLPNTSIILESIKEVFNG